jgi:hypothetical protein
MGQSTNWLRISATGDSHWNWFTWMTLLLLCLFFGAIVELVFHTWSWAWRNTQTAATIVKEGYEAEKQSWRTGELLDDDGGDPLANSLGAASINAWLSLVIPLFMTAIPALASLLGLSIWLNPPRLKQHA